MTNEDWHTRGKKAYHDDHVNRHPPEDASPQAVDEWLEGYLEEAADDPDCDQVSREEGGAPITYPVN